jgi:hypothetical protein
MNENSEFIKIFRCNICNKNYSSQSSLCNHNKKFHKNKTTMVSINSQCLVNDSKGFVNDSKGFVNDSKGFVNKNKCTYCDKILSCKQSKSQHQKICKYKNIINNEHLNLKNEINELKNTINILLQSNKIHPKTLQKINTQNNNTQNINNINNIQNNNVHMSFVQFGNENLSELLSKKEMQQILSQIRLSVEESIKIVHFNDKRPEYKNIFITNMKDNLAYIFNGNKFEVQSKDDILSDLLNNHLGNIECFIDDNNIQENYNNKNLFKFIREINGEDIKHDMPNYKKYKLDKIKQFIYNHSDKILLKKLNNFDLHEFESPQLI